MKSIFYDTGNDVVNDVVDDIVHDVILVIPSVRIVLVKSFYPYRTTRRSNNLHGAMEVFASCTS